MSDADGVEEESQSEQDEDDDADEGDSGEDIMEVELNPHWGHE